MAVSSSSSPGAAPGQSLSASQVAAARGSAFQAPPGGANDDSFLETALAPFATASVNQQHQQQQAPVKYEFRIITSNSHIQIIDNGSMIIKSVEQSDATRYVCQASNGINPSLSEVIELQVLSEYRSIYLSLILINKSSDK